jgi:hypothetical protein
MALQNLQQYGCQTGNKLKENHVKSSRNKNETMFGSGYENCPEFGVLGGHNILVYIYILRILFVTHIFIGYSTRNVSIYSENRQKNIFPVTV